MRKTITFSLSRHLTRIVDSVVQTGSYQNRSEFIRIIVRDWINDQLSQDEPAGKFTKTIRQVIKEEQKWP